MVVLRDREILELMEGTPPLVRDYVDLNQQLQPCGFDLTVRSISVPLTRGMLGIGSEVSLPRLEEIQPTKDTYSLTRGFYLATYNEVVSLPGSVGALVLPRSSLLRMGVTLHSAMWDPGYEGRGIGLMKVHNALGIKIRRNARIAQIVFFEMRGKSDRAYAGRYQGEGLDSTPGDK